MLLGGLLKLGEGAEVDGLAGVARRLAGGNEANRLTHEGFVRMAELGWESDDPSFRRHFTSRLIPDAPPEMARDVDEAQRVSVPRDNLRAFLDFDARLDVVDDLVRVRCPVLLIHARDDRMVPIADGRHLAERLADCRFLTVDGDNHVPVPGTADFDTTVAAVAAFLREHAPASG